MLSDNVQIDADRAIVPGKVNELHEELARSDVENITIAQLETKAFSEAPLTGSQFIQQEPDAILRSVDVFAVKVLRLPDERDHPRFLRGVRFPERLRPKRHPL